MNTLKNFIQSTTHPLLHLSVSNKQTQENDAKADMAFCYDSLEKVSRSFAMVIQQLPPDLKDAICVFYLVLRGLDTIEDDMTLEENEKDRLLRHFYRSCYLPDFNLHGIGDTEDYRHLLQHFDKVTRTFLTLKEEYKEIIADICFRMGNGMADCSSYPIKTTQDYDIYCHYVAGLVGQGLSELFSASGYENEDLAAEMNIANSMGLFLQKTNITRDFLEDFDAGRFFIPNEIWEKHHTELSFFKTQPKSTASLSGLNCMVEDALRHFPDCISYMEKLENPQVFRFCAIPQLMALATLIELYDNANVFMQNVKISRVLSLKIMVETTDFEAVKKTILQFIKTLEKKAESSPNTPPSIWHSIHRIKMALGQEINNPILF